MTKCGYETPNGPCKIVVKEGSVCRVHHTKPVVPKKSKSVVPKKSKTPESAEGRSGLNFVGTTSSGFSTFDLLGYSKALAAPKPATKRPSKKPQPKVSITQIHFDALPWIFEISHEGYEISTKALKVLRKEGVDVLLYWKNNEPQYDRADLKVMQEHKLLEVNRTYCFAFRDISRNSIIEKLNDAIQVDGDSFASGSLSGCSKLISVGGQYYVHCNLDGKIQKNKVSLVNFADIFDAKVQKYFASLISSHDEFAVPYQKAMNYFQQAKEDAEAISGPESRYYHYGIFLGDTPVGYIYVRPTPRELKLSGGHIRIIIDEKYRGRGIGAEALKQFRAPYTPMYSVVAEDNEASNALMRKVGYQQIKSMIVFKKRHFVYEVA